MAGTWYSIPSVGPEHCKMSLGLYQTNVTVTDIMLSMTIFKQDGQLYSPIRFENPLLESKDDFQILMSFSPQIL